MLKCGGVRGRTEAELGLFFFLLCTNSTNYGGFVRILRGENTELGVDF